MHKINSFLNLFFEAKFSSDNLRTECVLFVCSQIVDRSRLWQFMCSYRITDQ